MTVVASTAQNTAGKAVRRFIVFALLFILVAIAANGLTGLLARLVDAGVSLVPGDTSGLATSLAFTLIAGPLAAVLWWFVWRGLDDRVERDSALWGLYLAGMSTLALILGAFFLLSTASTLVSGEWDPQAFAAGTVWISVWGWHSWMAHHPSKSPTRLVGGARILGYAFGIVVGTLAAGQVIASLVELAVGSPVEMASAGDPWWVSLLQSAVWALGGAMVWWVHWVLDGGSRLRTGFAAVMVVLVAGLWAVSLTLSGIATALYVGLRLAFERGIPAAEILGPLGTAIAAASVGAVIWAYHRLHLRTAAGAPRLGVRLVGAGVALAITASGVGIVINSILASVVLPLAESDSRSLLFAGLSALVVGGPAWWLIWRPLAPVTAELAREAGRRIYLITVFGISALTLIVTLLVVAYQVFDFVLAGEVNGSLIDRIGSSVGLLVAAALVAGYHFSVWRSDRSLLHAEGARQQTIGRVVLVTGADRDAAVRAIRDATGAAVTVWTRADDTTAIPPAKLSAALEGVAGSRVLVVTGAKGVQVIPLES